ncbi:hypothetical protein GQ600_5899 [Phytophthora cactorum]|nr:hypothetical protein GQ600_5899 [Phytophthora cactorum]
MRAATALLVVVVFYTFVVGALSLDGFENSTLSMTQKTEILFMAEDDPDLFCSWQNGLWCNLDTAANNLKLGEVNKCELPVPDPQKIFDNDFARFARSFLLKNPKPQYIQITSTKRGSSTTLSTKQTLWSQYLANPALVQSEIKFDAPGLYDMETIGTELRYRYRAYTADTNVVNNANSDVLCGVSGVDKFARFKLFYESEKDCTGSCFDDAAKRQTWQSSNQLRFPTHCKPHLLSWKPHLTLSACGAAEKPESSRNSLRPTIVQPTAPKFQAAQRHAVLNTLTNKRQASTQQRTYITLFRAPVSTNLTPKRYTVKLSELLDVPTAFVTSFPTPSSESTNSKNYVFWRYNTDGSTFVKWDPLADTAISFVDASTTVVLEAWTACGRVNQFSFSVNLVVQNALTCSKFDSMWNFIEKYGIQGGEGAYCAYEGSDFAILKFDMAVADVLGQADSTGASTGVKCDIMVKETGAADTQVVTLVDDQISSRISKNYGVELVNNPTTAQKTTGVIHCKFTRAIQSNTRPELNCGKKEDMCSVRCAGDPAPGVYEACGGSIVASSATNTFLKTPTVPTCCNKCNKPLVCTSVSTTDIKRCELRQSRY